jgi:hypothetical protein
MDGSTGAWRKFEDVNDDACTNFAILGARAKGGNRDVDYASRTAGLRGCTSGERQKTQLGEGRACSHDGC